MVHIIGKYYAIPNEHGFQLNKHNGVNEKGAIKWIGIGYYGNMEEVCNATYRDYVNNKCSARAMELKEAIQIMRETKEMFAKIFRELEDGNFGTEKNSEDSE